MEVTKHNLRFFKSAADFRKWLDKNHDKSTEIWIGFYRKDSGKGGITYKEALDEALCYGWIDGIRKKLDVESFTNRFTPRKKNSIWSNVNVEHVARLTREGRMMPPGIAAYQAKDEKRTGVYSFERENAELDPVMKRLFRRNSKAWEFFESQPPYYRRMAAWWIISAKRDDTREKRLAELIAISGKEKRLAPFTPVSQRTRKK